MRYLAIGAATLAVLFTAYAVFYAITTPAQQMRPGTSGPSTQNLAPPVRGLYRGKDLFFIHTEASDPQVAAMLTRMMGPKVFTVPRLAKIPRDLLADVYVFTNGVKGDGPFGFQVDVFDAVPGEAPYSPLRAVTLVSWKDGATPRVLGSADEILVAERKGELALKHLGVVVNMPILQWSGGKR